MVQFFRPLIFINIIFFKLFSYNQKALYLFAYHFSSLHKVGFTINKTVLHFHSFKQLKLDLLHTSGENAGANNYAMIYSQMGNNPNVYRHQHAGAILIRPKLEADNNLL